VGGRAVPHKELYCQTVALLVSKPLARREPRPLAIPQRRTPRKTSTRRGVFWDKKTCRWRAQLGFQNRKLFMGYHDDEEQAAMAYDKKVIELHGFDVGEWSAVGGGGG